MSQKLIQFAVLRQGPKQRKPATRYHLASSRSVGRKVTLLRFQFSGRVRVTPSISEVFSPTNMGCFKPITRALTRSSSNKRFPNNSALWFSFCGRPCTRTLSQILLTNCHALISALLAFAYGQKDQREGWVVPPANPWWATDYPRQLFVLDLFVMGAQPGLRTLSVFSLLSFYLNAL